MYIQDGRSGQQTPSHSIIYFSLKRTANHIQYIQMKLITPKGIVIVFHIDRNRISRAQPREQAEVNFLKRFTLHGDPRIDIVSSLERLLFLNEKELWRL